MNSKHTRGPWKATYHPGTQTGPFWGIWADQERLAVLDATGPTDEANARLMAAAPKLLEALQAICNDCREVLEGREPLTLDLIHAIANGKARAALTRALGGTDPCNASA